MMVNVKDRESFFSLLLPDPQKNNFLHQVFNVYKECGYATTDFEPGYQN